MQILAKYQRFSRLVLKEPSVRPATAVAASTRVKSEPHSMDGKMRDPWNEVGEAAEKRIKNVKAAEKKAAG